MVKQLPISSRPPKVRSAAPSRLSGLKAFTILEVMMAAIVMAFAITTAITTLQRGFAAIDSARNMVVAGQIMQSEIEKMRISPWNTSSGITGMVDYTNTFPTVTIDAAFNDTTTGIKNVASRFTLTRSISDPSPGFRQITVTVTWTNYDGRQLTRSYTTYYGQYGLYDYFSS